MKEATSDQTPNTRSPKACIIQGVIKSPQKTETNKFTVLRLEPRKSLRPCPSGFLCEGSTIIIPENPLDKPFTRFLNYKFFAHPAGFNVPFNRFQQVGNGFKTGHCRHKDRIFSGDLKINIHRHSEICS